MSQTLQNLFNQALTAVGSAAEVTDPEASTKATNLLNLWYPVARHAILTAFHWPSVRGIKRLALVTERDLAVDWANTAPAPGYTYSYALPSDMLQPQFLEDYSPFKLGRVGTTKLLFSNNPEPILNYTMDEATPLSWEPDLYRCVIWALAASINMAKSGKMAITQKLEGQVVDLLEQAKLNAANADDEYYDAIPSFYSNTGFTLPNTSGRYYYPTATLRLNAVSP